MLCDNVGVYELNVRALKFHLKEEFNPDEFLEAINESKRRIEVLSNGSWWIKSYLPLQVKTLTPNNPPHVSYFEDLQSHGLLKKYVKENPDSVNLEVIFEMETSDKDNHKKMLHVLKSKTLLRPLQEAWYNSKEKEQEEEEEKDPVQEESKDQDQSPTLIYDSDKKKNNGKPTLNKELDPKDFFGNASLESLF